MSPTTNFSYNLLYLINYARLKPRFSYSYKRHVKKPTIRDIHQVVHAQQTHWRYEEN